MPTSCKENKFWLITLEAGSFNNDGANGIQNLFYFRVNFSTFDQSLGFAKIDLF